MTGWDQKTNELSFKDLIKYIILHDKENKTHGTNCSCMDQYIGAVRSMTTVKDSRSAQKRVDYVISSALYRRY